MPEEKEESFTDVLHELEKNKFAKSVVEKLHEQSKLNMWITITAVIAVLLTILLLNYGGKLTEESNGWIIAAIVGYVFGRGSQNIRL
jgi:hypothetical protein